MQIHEVILQQLGGNRFLTMTESKNITYSSVENNYLQMRLTRNKSGANFLKVTLDASDTYTMRFFKVTLKDYKPVITKEQPSEDCPKCGRHYNEIDYDYQNCSKCGWDAENESFGDKIEPTDEDFMNGDADLLTGQWN